MPLAFDESIQQRARERADTGAWSDVAELLNTLSPERGPGELRVLYAEALIRLGQERAACDWLKQVIPVLDAEADRTNHRRAINLFGVAAFTLGDLVEAGEAFTTALDLASRQDDLLLFARATNNLGAIANLQGRHVAALGHYRLAVPAYQRLGQRRGLAESYHNMAITHRDLGSLDEADEHERRAIDYAVQGTAPRLAAMGRIGRAEIALRRGDPELAEGTAHRAAEELVQLEDRLNEADARRLEGTAAATRARYDEAAAAFARALAIARERGFALVEAETLRDRALAHARRNAMADAHADAHAAILIFERLGANSEVVSLRARFPHEANEAPRP